MPLDVVVRGQARDQAQEDGAAASSVITRDRTPRGGESLPQLLGETPGVSIARLGGIGSLSLVSLRGSTAEQVLVYLDGVPLNAAVGGGLDLSTIPLGDIDRIEIYRGMSPMAFGSSAMGGIVSITTRPPQSTWASGELGVGDFGTVNGGAAASWAGERLQVHAGAHWQRSTGDFLYPSNNGTAFDPTDDRELPRQNNRLEQTDATLRVTVPLPGRRQLALLGSYVQRDQGLPGYAVFATKEVSLASLRALNSLAYRSTDDLGAGGRLQGTAYVLFNQTQFRDLLAEIAYGPASTRDRTRVAGSTWYGQKAVGPLRLGMVLDGRWEQFRPADTEQSPPLGPPATRLFGAAGVEAIATIAPARLELTPSLRYELAHDTVAGRNLFQDFVPPSPGETRRHPLVRLSAVQSPTDWLSFKANAGRYARLPNFTELYGDSGFVLGNPDLRPESGWNADAGLTVRWRGSRIRVRADAFAFASWVRDLIQYQQAGNGVQRAWNVGHARVRGLEGSASVDVGRWLRTFLQATWTDARDRTDSAATNERQLPLRPRGRAYARPEVRAIPLGRGFTAGFYGDVDVTSGNYVDPANLVRMPARLLVGAGVFARAPGGRGQFVISAHNLTDTRVSDFAGFPLPGRAFFASLSFTTYPAVDSTAGNAIPKE